MLHTFITISVGWLVIRHAITANWPSRGLTILHLKCWWSMLHTFTAISVGWLVSRHDITANWPSRGLTVLHRQFFPCCGHLLLLWKYLKEACDCQPVVWRWNWLLAGKRLLVLGVGGGMGRWLVGWLPFSVWGLLLPVGWFVLRLCWTSLAAEVCATWSSHTRLGGGGVCWATACWQPTCWGPVH